MFLLVPAYPGSPRQNAIKRLCVLKQYNTTHIKSFYNALDDSSDWSIGYGMAPGL